jgi:hypothetical protein
MSIYRHANRSESAVDGAAHDFPPLPEMAVESRANAGMPASSFFYGLCRRRVLAPCAVALCRLRRRTAAKASDVSLIRRSEESRDCSKSLPHGRPL